MIRIEVEDREADDELRKLQRGPGTGNVLKFDALLEALYQQTQVDVHIDTGSLKRSGKRGSEWRGNTWVGVIGYGGESEGSVHNPVRYARFEYRRGGDHDFFGGIQQGIAAAYTRAILEFFED